MLWSIPLYWKTLESPNKAYTDNLDKTYFGKQQTAIVNTPLQQNLKHWLTITIQATDVSKLLIE